MTKLSIIYYSATGHGTTMAKRVAAAAEYLMARYATEGEDIRVDVILLAPGIRIWARRTRP